MFGRRTKRKMSNRIQSLIGDNTQVIGDITFSGRLHVDGTVKGNVNADDDETALLTLSDRGTVEGEVRVPFVQLFGIVNGNVYAGERVELGSSARIEGDVYYSLIEMAMGAEVNGQLVHTSERERGALSLQHETAEDQPSNT